MWALLNDAEDAIEEIISNPKSMTINGITHSRQIFKWTTAELKAVGIVPVTTTGSHLDTNYYIEVDESFAIASDKASVVRTIGVKAADHVLADVNEVWTQEEIDDGYAPDGTSANDARNDEDGNQIVTLGLKSNAKNKATTQANGYLQGFEWLIARKVTANTAIPSAVTTYMAAIRTDHGNICTALDAASDMDAFIALHTTTYNADNTVNVIAKTQSWTSDANVKAYRR
jgi:hypothetical protein